MISDMRHRLRNGPPSYPGCEAYELGRFRIYNCVEDFWFVSERMPDGRLIEHTTGFIYSEFPEFIDAYRYLRQRLFEPAQAVREPRTSSVRGHPHKDGIGRHSPFEPSQ